MRRLIIPLFLLSSFLMNGLVQAEGSVARAIVTSGVADREPVNDLERVLAGNKQVFFFTDLRGMEGQTVKHRWSHGGEAMAEVEFNVGGPRWRVWSSKELIPEWAGDWKVEVIDGEGNVVNEKSFSFAGDGRATAASTEEPPAVEAVSEENVDDTADEAAAE